MSDRIEAARQWWSARSGREQVMLAAMGAAIAAMVGWYGVVVPLRSGAEETAERLGRAQSQLAQLRAATPARAPAAKADADAQSLVEAAAAKAGVTIARRRQDAGQRFTIWISAIDGRQLLPWVAGLEREGGLAVSNFTASRLDGGLVEAEITFEKVAP